MKEYEKYIGAKISNDSYWSIETFYRMFMISEMFGKYNRFLYLDADILIRDDYFNAGVLLMDLEKLRNEISFEEIISIMFNKKYVYNDQDILNSICRGRFKHLEIRWNYLIFYEHMRVRERKEEVREMFLDCYDENPAIIHYVGGNKPWDEVDVVMKDKYDEIVDSYNDYLNTKVECK